MSQDNSIQQAIQQPQPVARRLPINISEAFSILDQVGAQFKGDRIDHEMIRESLRLVGEALGLWALKAPEQPVIPPVVPTIVPEVVG
jgi:hypothetical protein